MGQILSGNKRKHEDTRSHPSPGDDSKEERADEDCMQLMNREGWRLYNLEQPSEAQLLGLGYVKYEYLQYGLEVASHPLLGRDDVKAKKPPNNVFWEEPVSDACETAIRWTFWLDPPGEDVSLGPIVRHFLRRMWLPPFQFMRIGNGNSRRAKSAEVFVEFKEMAFKLNGGAKPDEDFWTEHFTVRNKDYMKMGDAKRRFYLHLQCLVQPSTAKDPLRSLRWVTNNKKWLEDSGVYSAWEKHCAAMGGRPRSGGWVGEPKMTVHHHRRLRGTYFVDEYGEEWCVLLVEWDDEYDCNHAFYYDAALGDPPGNGVLYRYPRADGSRWPTIEDCEYSTVEQVDEWIAARHKPKKRARTT